MDRRAVVEKLLRAHQSGQWNMSSAFGGAMGINGAPQPLATDMNQAIEAWLHKGDSTGMQQVARTLHMTSSLTDTEYEQIMEAIGGEK